MSKETIARTAALAVSTLNAVLTMIGLNPLPWSDTEVYATASAIVEVALVAWAWWKNNSLTGAALEADRVLKAIKQGKLPIDDVAALLLSIKGEGTD
jgi:SPP1 family holin